MQTLNHLPVIQQPPQENKGITILPEDVLKVISNNLDLKTNVNFGSTGKLLKNATQDRRNLQILEVACGKSMYLSLVQNGNSIFFDQIFEITNLSWTTHQPYKMHHYWSTSQKMWTLFPDYLQTRTDGTIM